MEGVGDEGDSCIYLEVEVDLLVRALRSGHSAQTVTIKLTKKSGAYLSIEVTQVTRAFGRRGIPSIP